MRRTFSLSFAMFLLGLVIAPSSKASDFDKKTILTFNQPIEVPGAILSPGTYVVKRANPGANPDVIRFLTQNESRVLTTALAHPIERGEYQVTGRIELKFAERPAGQPEALQAWWYPGEITGEEFVYPKRVAFTVTETERRLSQPQPEPVVAPPPAPEPEPEAAAPAPAPEPEREIAQATPPPAPQAAQEPAPAPAELPKTSTTIPLIAALGLLAFSVGIGLRFLSRQHS